MPAPKYNKIRKAVCCQGYNNFKKSAVKLEKLNGIGKQKSEVPDTIKLYAGDL